ncbi:MAG: hypothetical protein ACXWP4_15380 [Polyangiales bacterium]
MRFRARRERRDERWKSRSVIVFHMGTGRSLALLVFLLVACKEPAVAGVEPLDASASPTNAGECKTDSECMVLASCDCGGCVASRKGRANICSEPCQNDPCAAHLSTCDHGTCVEHLAIACAKDTDCSAPPCGPCTEGTIVTRDMLAQKCLLNPCPKLAVGCEKGLCASR